MTAEEQSAAWCVPPEEIWFRAVLLKITDAIEDAAEITCMPQTAQNPGLLAHSAGGLEALRTLREEIERTRAEAFLAKK
ncbi:MAG: hypothetical protein ACO3GP_01290 [Candidatus Limnocylindrus sp.]|jgi:hypothetical protein